MRSSVAVLLLLVSAVSIAESIHAYKSVHTDGTVTYSDTRPQSASSVQTIEILPTDDATRDQGEQRTREMQAAGKQLDEQRAEQSQSRREYESRLAEARQEVIDAERYLDHAMQSKKNATPERIADAQERVKLARKRLREVESGSP